MIARIHDDIFYCKRKFAVFLQPLHAFGKQHRILSAGDTYCDSVALLNQLIILDTADKTVPDGLLIFFNNTLLYPFISFQNCHTLMFSA